MTTQLSLQYYNAHILFTCAIKRIRILILAFSLVNAGESLYGRLMKWAIIFLRIDKIQIRHIISKVGDFT